MDTLWNAAAAARIKNLAKSTASYASKGSKQAMAYLTVSLRFTRKHALKQVYAAKKYAVSVYDDLSVEVRILSGGFSGCINSIKNRIADSKHAFTMLRLGAGRIVCVRSFFSGAFTQAGRMRRKWIAASSTLCAALALSVAIINSTFSLDLYYRGQEVGVAGDITEVTQIVNSTEQQLAEILGREYPLSESLSLSATLRKAEPDAEAVKDNILSSVDGVEKKYVLLVDGEVVGASDEEEVLSDMLDGVLNEFTSDATDSVRFASDVSVVEQFVSEEVVSDPEVIKTLIAPDNETSEYSLAVENVESTLISEEIPYEIEYIEDDTLYDDESILVEKGESGVVLVTEKLLTLNGVEQWRERVGEMVAKEPVTEVVAVGTVPRPATASFGEYIWPAEGPITSYYGSRFTSVGSSNHKGLDIGGKHGQNIYAADGGEVIFSGWKKAYGYMVQIRHDNGDETVYGHNSSLLVNVGDKVARGQVIALMGSTGLSTGVHCHFEIRIGGEPVDPYKFLS